MSIIVSDYCPISTILPSFSWQYDKGYDDISWRYMHYKWPIEFVDIALYPRYIHDISTICGQGGPYIFNQVCQILVSEIEICENDNYRR
jgi:hypothetical protein